MESVTGYSLDTCTVCCGIVALQDKWALQVDFAHLCTKDLLICGKRLVVLVQNKQRGPLDKHTISLPSGF